MDELNIAYYEQRSRRIFGDDLSQQEILRDLDTHARVVIEAVQEEHTNSIGLAQQMRSREANEYVLYGVGRRLSMLVFALRSLLQIAHPAREAPIDVDEGRALTRDLNVVYINVVGVIDNLAWAAFHEIAPEALSHIQPTQIGLFTRAIGRTLELEGLVAALEPYRAWFEELRARRDPAAHRIPLYLPPALLNEEQVAEHNRLTEHASEAIRRHDWNAWDDIMSEQQRLGRFYPVFLHAPSEPLYRFYPTVPEDAGKMVKIIREVSAFLV